MRNSLLKLKNLKGGGKLEEEEKIEVDPKASLIALRLVGDEDGLQFELAVQSTVELERVEEVFYRVFERVQFLLNDRKGDNREVI